MRLKLKNLALDNFEDFWLSLNEQDKRDIYRFSFTILCRHQSRNMKIWFDSEYISHRYQWGYLKYNHQEQKEVWEKGYLVWKLSQGFD